MDLDDPCWSPRDVLELVAAVAGTKPRDGCAAVTDAVLDAVGLG